MQNKIQIRKYLKLKRNHVLVIAIIFILLIGSCKISALSWRGNWQNTALEFLSASAGNLLVGLPSASVITGITSDSFPNIIQGIGSALNTFLVSYNLSGGSIGSPLATLLSGNALRQNGSTWGSYAGGIVGTGLGLITMLSTYKNNYSIATLSSILLPSIASVIGYNLFPRSFGHIGMLPQNFPAFGLTVVPQKKDKIISAKFGANITFKF
jgi:hypothetical protein